MEHPILTSDKFKYIQSKEDGEVLLLLHGLFGGLSNFTDLFEYFKDSHRVIIPMLPIYELPLLKVSVSGLVDYIDDFVDHMGIDKVHVLGNSLGGHIAILYALKRPEKISSVTLTGSSGLFESAMGSTYPRRGDYNLIKKKTESTFFRPEVATKELIDEVFSIVNDRSKGIRIVATAKSAVRHNLEGVLHGIVAPTCLIWGKNDSITPPFVAEKFHELIKNSQLFFLDECGHSPMMEKPEEFNAILKKFLSEA